MRILTVVFWIMMLLLFSECAKASGMEEWKTHDYALEGTFIVAEAFDWAQTQYVVKHPDQYYERVNPFLGKHPSSQAVTIDFAVEIAAHAGVSYLLPPKWRTAWQVSSIAWEVSLISQNRRIGIKYSW